MQTKAIGFIGLGAMGIAMCSQLLRAGLSVRGFDIDPGTLARFVGLGGIPASSASEAARGTDLLVVMVHNARQVEEVLFGPDPAVPGTKPGATVWLASTVSPIDARRFGERLHSSGRHLLDGPVSGGVTGARDGSLTIMASGSPQAFTAAEDVLRLCGKQIFSLGESAGTASTVKMINQLLTASHIALTAEAVSFATRAGIDPAILIDVIRQSAGNSRQFEKRAPRMAAGDHDPQSTVNIFLKDLRIALEAAASLDFPAPMAATAHQIFTLAAAAGLGKASDTRLIDVYGNPGKISAP